MSGNLPFQRATWARRSALPRRLSLAASSVDMCMFSTSADDLPTGLESYPIPQDQEPIVIYTWGLPGNLGSLVLWLFFTMDVLTSLAGEYLGYGNSLVHFERHDSQD